MRYACSLLLFFVVNTAISGELSTISICPRISLISQITDPDLRHFIDSMNLCSRLCACPPAEPTEIAEIVEYSFIEYGKLLKSRSHMTFQQAIAQKNAAMAKKDILYGAILYHSPEKFQTLVNMGICQEPHS